MRKSFEMLSFPMISELPFMLAFLLMMGILDVIKRLFERLFSSEMPLLEQQVSNIAFGGEIALLFFWSYLFANILFLCRKKWIKISFYSITIILFAVKRFIKSNFGIGLSAQVFTLIAETNTNEAVGFFHTYGLSLASFLTYLYTLLYIVMIIILEKKYQLIREKILNHQSLKFFLSFVCMIILMFGTFFCSTYVTMMKGQTSDNLTWGIVKPRDPISDIMLSIRSFQLVTEEIQKEYSITENVINTSLSINEQDSVVIVLVIGESYIKYHSHLYGYCMSTTPHLDQEKERGNLFVFDDVVSPYNFTSKVIKNMLCCNSIGDGEKWYDYPYFPAIFKKAGYDVYFWDNQNYSNETSFSFSLQHLLFGEKMKFAYTQVNDSCYDFDEELINSFKKKVGIFENKHNLVLFHLMGQHAFAKDRYPNFPPPQGYSYFSADSIARKDSYLTDAAKQYIAEYDNATLYNDKVMANIIDLFRDRSAVIIYLSDHGETAYDYSNKWGRDFDLSDYESANYQLDIPFVIWCSEKYKAGHSETTSALSTSLHRPFMSDNLCHLMFHLGGISTHYYNEERDLISPNYKIYKRIVVDEVDYDMLRRKARAK